MTTAAHTHYFSVTRLGRDYGFLLPGFFISLAAFVILVPLTALSAGTIIVWIGVLLFLVTLTVATAFAQISRARLAWWRSGGVRDAAGHGVADIGSWGLGSMAVGSPLSSSTSLYRARGRGPSAWLRQLAEPRRWLDLLYETLIAFPLHVFTFAVSVSWGAGAIGSITYFFWGFFLPDDGGVSGLLGLVLEAASNGLAPDFVTHSYLLEAASQFVTGVILLLTLPAVVHGLAVLDALVMEAALEGSVRLDPGAPGQDSPASHAGGEADVGGEADPRGKAGPGPARAAVRGPSARSWAWIVAGVVTVAGLAIDWPLLAVLYGMGPLWSMLVALGNVGAVLLAVRWRYPAVVLEAAAVAATVLLSAPGTGAPWPWPVMTLLLHCAVIMFVALSAGRRGGGPGTGAAWLATLTAWVVPLAASVAALMVSNRTGGLAAWEAPARPQGGAPSGSPAGGWLTDGTLTNLIVAASITVAAAVVALALRAWADSVARLRAERKEAAQTSAERSELAERNRIARELHDVVAHSMSVISVQATTAPYRLPELDEPTKQEFASIADSSRKALAEMRGLLAVLRAKDGQAPTAPQPSLAELDELIANTRSSGARISLHHDEPERLERLPAAASLTAFRIVQEGLSNALRHSPGAAIDVVFRFADARLHIDVCNGPVPDHAGYVPAAPGAGLGLKGIRERAEALGGTVHAEPMSGGGFDLHAELPV